MEAVENDNYKDPEKAKLNEVEEDDSANADPEFDDSKAQFLNGGKGLDESKEEKKSDSKSFTGLGKEELMQYANDPFWRKVRLGLFILFWVGWLAMLVAAIVIIVLAPRCPPRPDHKWWQTEMVYKVYPKSFKDSGSDGLGDLKGIADKQQYFSNLTTKVLWLNPVYASMLRDSGFDVTNHSVLNSEFGEIEEFKKMLKKFHKKGLKVVLDFIPNHTDRNHTWFEKSRNKEGDYADYYIWADCTEHTRPNNWNSIYGGSAWAYDYKRKQCYLHQYLDTEPDLNLRNPKVKAEIESILRYWLTVGVDGFHIVGAPFLIEANTTNVDEKSTGLVGVRNTYDTLIHNLTAHQPETLQLIKEWRKIVEEFSKPGREKLLFATMSGDVNTTLPYLGDEENPGVHFVPSDIFMEMSGACDAECMLEKVEIVLDDLPDGGWTGWMLGDEDHHRLASRFDTTKLKALHTLQMLLPGTAFNYYGDEIGLVDEPLDFSETVDPLAEEYGKFRYEEHYRDPFRTPMRWTSNCDASNGFTGGNPWLPIKNCSQHTVQDHKAVFAGYTNLAAFWKLGKLRQEPSFRWGKLDYIITNNNILSFVRQADGFPGFLVAINFGEVSQTNRYYVEPKSEEEMPLVKPQAMVEFHSHIKSNEGVPVSLKDRAIILEPGHAVVMKFMTE